MKPTRLIGAMPVVLAILAIVAGHQWPWLRTPLIIAMSFGLASLGVAILIRAGQVSFGHAGFACLAGYVVVGLSRRYPQLDATLLLVVGLATGCAAGALVGLFITRYRGIFFGMLNLALSMVLFAVLGKFYHLTGGTDGLRMERPPMFGQMMERAAFESWLLGVGALLIVLACWFVSRFQASPAGHALVAIKTNEVRLEYLGVSARRVFYIGYVVSAMFCGLSGALFGLIQGLVTPEMGYWVRSGEFVFIAVLGGTMHPVGAFLGAIAFEFIKLFAAAALTGIWQMVIGIVLLVLIFVAPNGLVGWLVRRRVAKSAA